MFLAGRASRFLQELMVDLSYRRIMQMGLQFRKLHMFDQCPGGTGHQALSACGTVGEIQGLVQGGGDPQFVAPVGKIEGRSAHQLFADTHTPPAQDAFGRVVDDGRTGPVNFVGTSLPGHAALPDVQVLRQGLQFAGAIALAVEAIVGMVGEQQLHVGFPGFEHPGGMGPDLQGIFGGK